MRTTPCSIACFRQARRRGSPGGWPTPRSQAPPRRRALTTPRLAVSIANTITRDSVPQWNTVAELRGSELPGQVVIVGAHLDSWDLGTGTTDNGTGAMCTL